MGAVEPYAGDRFGVVIPKQDTFLCIADRSLSRLRGSPLPGAGCLGLSLAQVRISCRVLLRRLCRRCALGVGCAACDWAGCAYPAALLWGGLHGFYQQHHRAAQFVGHFRDGGQGLCAGVGLIYCGQSEAGTEEAAEDLGADPVRVFTRVTLPLSMPGIVSGITMTFLPAMTNYVILDMMYNSTYIMGSLIGSYFNIYDWNNGSMISLILFAVICIVSIITGGEDQDDAKNRGAVL